MCVRDKIKTYPSVTLIQAQLAVALGGRLAEEIIFGEDNVTTGASNDIQQVANIAKRMVAEWGMSDKVGLLCVQEDQQGGGPFMGRQMGQVSENARKRDRVDKYITKYYFICKAFF